MILTALNARTTGILCIAAVGLFLSSPVGAASYKCKDKSGNWTEAACTGALTPPEELRLVEEQKQLAVELGPKPEPSAWDGSYRAVNTYLEKHAKDPDSVKIDGCTAATATAKGWIVRCEYRAKNSFGAVVRGNTYFAIKQNAVVATEEVK